AETEPTLKATVVPSASAIQRAIDDVMPLRATPTAAANSEPEGSVTIARSVDEAPAPSITPRVAKTTSVEQTLAVQRTASSEARPPITPLGGDDVKTESRPSVTQRAESTVQRTTTEPATPEVPEITHAESPAPIARLIDAAPTLTDTPSIQRHIDQ